mmetsp:Transcript_10849/g.9372  ORF Transcript_10849/g.9372 Transcript_10849/m.9372 type:complete len:172 (-) Transcript_10849:359-874(-)|eukprot:CAMPEP_0114578406 /NCGR_PEP_ID=MMETSP0125-20121206/2945_1 /TAXON_ID=485358 ORGANISM="Aristerostoma sp., Strain ATCC 50986" /NCGR_SAMPLE_ID=MMETSP0125 /ASSEMBLY_ACC=CAM_ASM_000245 /LENGTH=171 /DNA_ID=CAMNT_0001768443 /DNA_START=1105 /DNA_END=1620 /DNA_ORIENTATION=-
MAGNSRYVPYFNPSFVDKAHQPDNYRYAENPFKHTNHEHYFKNYYTGLKGDYLDRHYTKTSPGKREYSHTKYELPSTSTYNRYSKYGLINNSQPLRFQPDKYSKMTPTNYRGSSNYRSQATTTGGGYNDYYPAKYNLDIQPLDVQKYLNEGGAGGSTTYSSKYVPGQYTGF